MIMDSTIPVPMEDPEEEILLLRFQKAQLEEEKQQLRTQLEERTQELAECTCSLTRASEQVKQVAIER